MPSDIGELKRHQNGLDTSMTTYLPVAPAGWYDFWTNTRYSGGSAATADCPIDRLPLFIKAGSIIPFGPNQQWATQKPDAPYEIRIYPGADAKFTIYEDDNETYAYERGQRATYELKWNDSTKTLSIGDRQGTFPGMDVKRRLDIVLATPDGNSGESSEPFDPQTIIYDGTAQSVKF